MAESLAQYYSNISDEKELSEKLKILPPYIKGKVAELTGNIYKESVKGTTLEGLPHSKICYKIALESYKTENDTDGMKRIGDVYVASGDFEKAIDIFETIQSIDPKLLESERISVLLHIKSEVINRKIREDKRLSQSNNHED
jgi:tetratricopeptide (TPR) repeat protein